MDEQYNHSNESDRPMTITARDIAAVIFRHRRLSLICMAAVILAIVAGAIVLPKYESEMKVLVKRGRQDPVVTSAEANEKPPQLINNAVTEEELNSEIELLTSDDLLRQVVLANHLQDDDSSWFQFGKEDEELRIQEAVRTLKRKLNVEGVKKANVITASYKAKDAQLSYAVMKSLSTLYMEKHVNVHRPPGEFQFFEKETTDSRKELSEAESRLKQFPQQSGAVSPGLERDITLTKLNEFRFSLETTRAQLRATQDRIRELKGLQTSTPDRITTQSRRSDNPQLLQQLKSTLLQLELQRTALLSKYQPSYRPVQEVEKQIAETKAAIAAEDAKPVREEVTDQNPTHEWVRGDLAKSEADMATLQAQVAAIQRSVAMYEQMAQNLDTKAIVLHDLQRVQKVQEDNYLLYLRKREEARINGALDKTRILNVAFAEEPTRPVLPAHPRWIYAMAAGLFMFTFGAGMVYVADRLDPSFRTPDEVLAHLGVPVLAAVPAPEQNVDVSGNGGPRRAAARVVWRGGSACTRA